MSPGRSAQPISHEKTVAAEGLPKWQALALGEPQLVVCGSRSVFFLIAGFRDGVQCLEW